MNAVFSKTYSDITSSNIPVFININDSKLHQSYAAALEINNAVTTANDIEYYLQKVNSIFLSNLDSNYLFILNDETENDLKEIAELNGGMYGEGVYKSIELLDTVLHVYDEYLPEKLFSELPQTFSIYPNPAQNDFIVEPIIDNVSYGLEIFDLSGVKQMEKNNLMNISSIDISMLPGGLFLIKLTTQSGSTQFFKLQIQ